MKLVIYCKKCRVKNHLKLKAKNRNDLRSKYGEKIEVECSVCLTKSHYNPIEVKAEDDFLSAVLFIITLISMIILIIVLWKYAFHKLSSIYLIPIGLIALLKIYTAIAKTRTDNIKYFNRS